MQPAASGVHPSTSEARLPVSAVGPQSWTRLTLALVAHAAVRPQLARALVRVAWRFRSRHWFRRFPFLPLPARAYVRWRMHTAYGDPDVVPPMRDIIRYARWAASRH